MFTLEEGLSLLAHLFLTCILAIVISAVTIFGFTHLFNWVLDAWYKDLAVILATACLATLIASTHFYFLFKSDTYLTFMKRILEKEDKDS